MTVPFAGALTNVNTFAANEYALVLLPSDGYCTTPSIVTIKSFALAGTLDKVNEVVDPLPFNVSTSLSDTLKLTILLARAYPQNTSVEAGAVENTIVESES